MPGRAFHKSLGLSSFRVGPGGKDAALYVRPEARHYGLLRRGALRNLNQTIWSNPFGKGTLDIRGI